MLSDVVSVALPALVVTLDNWPYSGVKPCVVADFFDARRQVVKNGLGCAIIRATKGSQEADSLVISQRMPTALGNKHNGA